MENEKPRIGFIGTGVMGRSMAGHLLKAGYRVGVFNRSPEKTEELVKSGATQFDTPGDIAENSDVIITIVGFPKDVEQVYFGENGVEILKTISFFY